MHANANGCFYKKQTNKKRKEEKQSNMSETK